MLFEKFDVKDSDSHSQSYAMLWRQDNQWISMLNNSLEIEKKMCGVLVIIFHLCIPGI